MFSFNNAQKQTASTTPAFSFGNTTANNISTNGKPVSLLTTSTNATTSQAQPQQSLGLSMAQPQQNATTTAATQIDLAHIRPTTKFDLLQKSIQDEIEALENAILNSQKTCAELTLMLPKIQEQGEQLAPAVEFISEKLEELDAGLENDAVDIVSVRDDEVSMDVGEAKCVFRAIDRLRVPRQYQTTGGNAEVQGASVLGGSGLGSDSISGWWNAPTQRRSAAVERGMLVQDEEKDADEAPKNLAGLFETRAHGFTVMGRRQKELLKEIEAFVEGLEEKVLVREKELQEKINYGGQGTDMRDRKEEEREKQLGQLKYVFGEVQRGLYEKAEKVGIVRDSVVELGMMR